MEAYNPIIRGFHPDPSICRAGEYYYLVNSTLGFFPGLPIYRSRDLCRWELIGNALDRAEQIPLRDCCVASSGIYAPTLRYHNGVFYIIVANMIWGGTMIFTAENPAGPWSEPQLLGEFVYAFDPSLFFDEDGSCYLTASHSNSAGERFYGDLEVFCQKLDLNTLKLTGEQHTLWHGALQDVEWVEGSHLYRHDGLYYLIVAEGGTGRNHAVTVARSKELFGTYTGCPANPILTHRHMGIGCPVINVGHGDMVCAEDGRWYMVVLGSRPDNGLVLLGRETFLAKVEWQDGWPVVNPGIGQLEEIVMLPGRGERPILSGKVYTFTEAKLPPEFLTLRNPPEGSFETGNGLQLRLHRNTLTDNGGCAFWGLRQEEHSCRLSADMELPEPAEGEEAGLALVHSEQAHLRFTRRKKNGRQLLAVLIYKEGRQQLLYEAECRETSMTLRLCIRGLLADAEICTGSEVISWYKDIDLRFLSTELAGGFVGCVLGVYASANGEESSKTVRFSRLELE